MAGNVVPDEARLRVNYRFAPDRDCEMAEAFVRELLRPVLADATGLRWLTVLRRSPGP